MKKILLNVYVAALIAVTTVSSAFAGVAKRKARSTVAKSATINLARFFAPNA